MSSCSRLMQWLMPLPFRLQPLWENSAGEPWLHKRHPPPCLLVMAAKHVTVDKNQSNPSPSKPTPSCRRRLLLPTANAEARACPWLQDQGTWSHGSQWASSALNTGPASCCATTVNEPVLRLGPAVLSGGDVWLMEPPGQPTGSDCDDASPRAGPPRGTSSSTREAVQVAWLGNFLANAAWRKLGTRNIRRQRLNWGAQLKTRGLDCQLNSQWSLWVTSNRPQFPHV